MRKDTRNKIIAFSIPLVILVGMTVAPFMTVLTGDEIKLETKPVDPTDLFRGDYVTLSYKAEEVHESKVDKKIKDHFLNDDGASYGDKSLIVYSILEEDKHGIHQVKKVVADKPDSGLYLKGKMDYLWLDTDETIREYTETEEEFEKEKANQTAEIYYQLDKFFVPENTGGELENAINNVNDVIDVETVEKESDAVATVKVRNGHAILTNVEVID